VDYQRSSSQFKAAILTKLSQSGLSVRKFAEQERINLSTLYSWQKHFNTSGLNVSKVSSSDKWSSEAVNKFTNHQEGKYQKIQILTFHRVLKVAVIS
jgi:transposase-like protein